MCGIVGFIDSAGGRTLSLKSTVLDMCSRIEHRGPDDAGSWVDAQAGVALGHRRLSIIDLSSEGHQPMCSPCGRYVISFNGEIYNHRELRRELASSPWRGHSDTEVMLAAISQWGVQQALSRFNGMFVFALWDRLDRVLHLARDRMGEKPLYYGWMNHIFVFASELKALRAHPAWCGEINRDALALYMRHNYIPAPHSIYHGISKLAPGSLLSLPHADAGSEQAARISRYWSLRGVAEDGERNPLPDNEHEMQEALDSLLRDAVALRMEADVPLGAFLSGGYDSSLIVALMQAESSRPVRTFSIGFHEDGYNEAEYAKAVAGYLGTDHTELYVTPTEAMDVIPILPSLYDEPFSDSSQIPTMLVSQLAARHVKVALSGDGGDELFYGYKRYELGRDLWRRIGWLPSPCRRWMAAGIKSVPQELWDRGGRWLAPMLARYGRPGPAGDKLYKLADVLADKTPESMYRRLVSHWKEPSDIVKGAQEPPTVLSDSGQWAKLEDFNQRMMFLDCMSYLPDDILVKVDRASMGVSLEARVPLLDHRVVEFAWRLPFAMKVNGGRGKWPLRRVLYRHVPQALMDRPKMGFGVPVDAWLRGPLREWAEALLDEKRLEGEGYFNPAPIREKWSEHLSGARNWQYHLWDVLMFQAWLDEQRS